MSMKGLGLCLLVVTWFCGVKSQEHYYNLRSVLQKVEDVMSADRSVAASRISEISRQLYYLLDPEEAFRQMIKNTNPSDGDKDFLNASAVHNVLHSIDKMHRLQRLNAPEDILNLSNSAMSSSHKTTPACTEQLAFILSNIRNQWVAKILDSWGRPRFGLLESNIKWLGSFDECLSINVPADDTLLSQDFTTKYCVADIPIELPLIRFDIAMCVPYGCENDDVLAFLNSTLSRIHIPDTISRSMSCKTRDYDRKFPAGSIVALMCFGFLIGFCILATTYDCVRRLYKSYAHSDLGSINSDKVSTINCFTDDQYCISSDSSSGSPHSTSVSEPNLLLFSIYSNGKKLLDTDRIYGDIGCLYGIKFISLCWVVQAHTLLFFTFGRIQNLFPIRAEMKDWYTEMLMSASVVADSFFVVSGLLTSYHLIKDFHELKPKLIDFFKSLPMLYLQRYLRLVFPYAVMLIFYSCFLYFMGSGPYWPEHPRAPQVFDKYCPNYWYLNILFVNNIFIADDHEVNAVVDLNEGCAGWTWYLANDFQFYLVSPFVIYLYYRKEAAGLIVATVMVLGSIGAAFGAAHLQKMTMFLMPGVENTNYTVPHLAPTLPEYYTPWSRFQTYGIGLIAGLALWKFQQKNMKINMILNIFLWGVAAAICLAVVFGPHDADDGGHVVHILEADIYNSFARTGWGLSMAFVIISCALGAAGGINRVLSWNGFIPVSRMAYCAYLLHMPVLLYLAASDRSPIIYTSVQTMADFFSALVIIMVLSFAFSIFFEIPFLNLIKKYLHPLSVKRARCYDKVLTELDAANQG